MLLSSVSVRCGVSSGRWWVVLGVVMVGRSDVVDLLAMRVIVIVLFLDWSEVVAV